MQSWTAEIIAAMIEESLFGNAALSVPFPPPSHPRFKFIDLFAGIGGFRMAMQNLGGECVFSSEWDAQAQRTYYANYGEMPYGDITSEETKSHIPDGFDILCAGFPCQAQNRIFEVKQRKTRESKRAIYQHIS